MAEINQVLFDIIERRQQQCEKRNDLEERIKVINQSMEASDLYHVEHDEDYARYMEIMTLDWDDYIQAMIDLVREADKAIDEHVETGHESITRGLHGQLPPTEYLEDIIASLKLFRMQVNPNEHTAENVREVISCFNRRLTRHVVVRVLELDDITYLALTHRMEDPKIGIRSVPQ